MRLGFSSPIIQYEMDQTVSNALTTAASQGVVARKVDVVAHSMGGLVTRYYMQNPLPFRLPGLPPNPIHQLVTVGTPHRGTPLATALEQYKGNQNGAPGTSVGAAVEVGIICALNLVSKCTLSNLFQSQEKTIDEGVLSLETGLPDSVGNQYNSIVGLKPESPISTTEYWLNPILFT